MPEGHCIELRQIPGPSRYVHNLDDITAFGPGAFWAYSVCAMKAGGSPITNQTAALASCCWVDIDLIVSTVKSGGLAERVTIDILRPHIVAVSEALLALPWAPSAIVFSGGGVHAYWKFTEPSDDMEGVRRTNELLAAIVGGDEAVKNVGRVLRCPGSFNDKYAAPVQAQVLGGRATAWEREYELDDLLAELPGYVRRDVVEVVAQAQEDIATAVGAEMPVPVATASMIDGRGDWAEWEEAARAGENWNTNCLKLVGRWVALGWSDQQIVERGKSLMVSRVERLGGSPATIEETKTEFAHFIRSARSKGFEPARTGRGVDYDVWRDDWALIETSGRFVRLSTRTEMTSQTWRMTNSYLAAVELDEDGNEKRVGYIKRWMNDPEAFRLHDYVMAPDEPLITAGNCLNLWREYRARIIADDGQDPETSEAVALVRQLLLFLCDDRQDVADQFMNWVGRLLHRPAERAKWGVLLISDLKGAGKSLLGNLIGELYGHEASISLGGLDALVGNYPGDVLTGKAFVCVHEATDRGDSGKFGSIERIKSMVTEPTLSLNRKGLSQVSVDNYCRLLLLSNHEDAIPMDDNERRFMVINCQRRDALPAAFYDRFVDVCFSPQGLADLARWSRDDYSADLPNRAPRVDMDTVQDSLTSDWVATLNERVAEAYVYGVRVAAADMVRVANQIAGMKLPNFMLSKELKRGGWLKKQFKRNGKMARGYTNNVQASEWADDFATKVGDSDELW